MARLARVVLPGMPQQVTQRGNGRQPTFFGEEADGADVELLAEWCEQRGVEVWADCRMPNHGHGIAVPPSEHRLRLAMSEAHRRYPRRVNFRRGWRGHWWPGRFPCFVMDEPDLLAAARDVELNPVPAKLVAAPSPYRRSSARAHRKAKTTLGCVSRRGWRLPAVGVGCSPAPSARRSGRSSARPRGRAACLVTHRFKSG